MCQPRTGCPISALPPPLPHSYSRVLLFSSFLFWDHGEGLFLILWFPFCDRMSPGVVEIIPPHPHTQLTGSLSEHLLNK